MSVVTVVYCWLQSHHSGNSDLILYLFCNFRNLKWNFLCSTYHFTLVGKNVSFGVEPGFDFQLPCLLAVTLGKFLDILVFSLENGDIGSTHFLGFWWELNELLKYINKNVYIWITLSGMCERVRRKECSVFSLLKAQEGICLPVCVSTYPLTRPAVSDLCIAKLCWKSSAAQNLCTLWLL